MNRWTLIDRSVRISAAVLALNETELAIREKRARQHRFQHMEQIARSPMYRARSGSYVEVA
ncbi:MAG TPA: hypothetical protein PK819_00225 [Thermomicrobiales bacterium]|mgnify:CR=1 FL=1|nr:hypothetical protein [Thermomicrobiales bacterium]